MSKSKRCEDQSQSGKSKNIDRRTALFGLSAIAAGAVAGFAQNSSADNGFEKPLRPQLKIVLGHMGEALPFWMWRLDFMGAPGGRAGRFNKLKPSEYFKRNFAITTSGVEDPLVLRFCIDKLGAENIMWAIDYPFQPTAPAVAFLENATLSEQEGKQIAHGNAERIFKINAASENSRKHARSKCANALFQPENNYENFTNEKSDFDYLGDTRIVHVRFFRCGAN